MMCIRYTVPDTQQTVNSEVQWCQAQGWRHVLDWRWFWNSTISSRSVNFHFEDHRHAHWFMLRWGGHIEYTE